MRIAPPPRLVLVLLAAGFAFAGCGGSFAQPGTVAHPMPGLPQGARSWIVAEAKSAKQLLYVGAPFSSAIDIFSLRGLNYKLVGQIDDENAPEGMTTDAAGNLYVADEGVATEGPEIGDIAVYHPGETQPFRYIVPAKWVPFDIAVDAKGTMYVANIAPIGSFSPGSVTIYHTNSDQPVRTLRLQNFQVDAVTLHADSTTIYIAYDTGQTGRIARFTHARGKALDLGVSFDSPWGISEDGSDNLLACSGDGAINVYAEATGQLVQSIPVPNAAMFEAFTANRSRIFVSNFEQVEILSYPAGAVLGMVQQPGWSKSSWPTGVAIWPPPK